MRLLVTAAAAAACALSVAAPAALAAPGDLDPTFGGDGIVTAAPGDASRLNALALQGGAIVGAGAIRTGECQELALARWLSGGTLDAGFGDGGLVRTPSTPCDEPVSAGGEYVSLAVRPDGGMFAGGFHFRGNGDGGLVGAYGPDGDPDTLFGGDGLDQTGFVHGRAAGVVAGADGGVTAGGWEYGIGRANWELRRYLSDGAPDASFSDDGVADFPSLGHGQDTLSALVADGAGGATVAVGTSSPGQGSDLPSGTVIGRIRDDGTLDPEFGTDGRTLVPYDHVATARDVARTSDGSFVVAGYTSPTAGAGRWLLQRFDEHGQLDPAFGAGGQVDGPVGYADAVAVDAQQRLVVSGHDLDGAFLVARYLVNGAIDETFGDAGVARPAIGGSHSDVLVQPDGAIVVGLTGRSGGRDVMLVARLQGGDGAPGQGSTEGEIQNNGSTGESGGHGPDAKPGPSPGASGTGRSRQAGGVSIRLLNSRVTKRGVLVRVTWPAGTDGTARARLWTRNKGILLGERSVTAAPPKLGRTFRVPLNARAKALLRGGKRLKIAATVRVTGLPARR
ncbi:MAG TPA: hypothetical protein VF549_00945 [Solirubrobacteraceae bacterium]|jgi:uncharacterized delta-60 repeat protein